MVLVYDTQHNNIALRYAVCRAECRVLFSVMLSVAAPPNKHSSLVRYGGRTSTGERSTDIRSIDKLSTVLTKETNGQP
jgi:hypothetical protein